MTVLIASISTSLAPYTPPRAKNAEAAESGESPVAASEKELSSEQQAQVQKLAETDRKVRAHENAHLAAAAGIAVGGANFSFETGPDGKRYAVGGEVQISVSEGKTPADTIVRAEQVRRAALAPADPSAQDQKVAAEASQMAARARMAQVMASLQGSYSDAPPKGSLIDAQA
jgi:hypothetical protein